MKKLINDPTAVIDEMLDGRVAAHPDRLRRLEGTDVVVRADGPTGRSGSSPAAGAATNRCTRASSGRGCSTAPRPGTIFTSPPAIDFTHMPEAADAGAVVLAVIKNYEGDLMNFDTAAELADVEYDSVVVDSWADEYCTSLDMAGCSVTLLRVDDELRELLEYPVSTPGLTVEAGANSGR